jgi:hypothetical protein
MLRCVLSTCTPDRTAAQQTPARTGRYCPCTHSPHKLPASRFRYSPNARPRPCSDACLARDPTSHRRTGDACTYWPVLALLAPMLPDKMPASRFRYSPNARPRPSMLRCVLSTCTPDRTAAQETPARTGRYYPCTHSPDKLPASRFRYSPNARPQPCRDACLARAPHIAPPHRRRLHVKAGTGLAPTPADKMPAPRFRYSPNARPRSITTRVEHPTTHRRTGDVCTYTPVLALHPRLP